MELDEELKNVPVERVKTLYAEQVLVSTREILDECRDRIIERTLEKVKRILMEEIVKKADSNG